MSAVEWWATSDVIENVVRADSETTVALCGELDVSTIATVRDVLEQECARRPSRIVVDLAHVEFVDSSALHAFVVANKRLEENGGSLRITGVSDVVRRTFEIVGLDEVFFSAGNGNGRPHGP
jgi:anti-sigma B factor antagonist